MVLKRVLSPKCCNLFIYPPSEHIYRRPILDEKSLLGFLSEHSINQKHAAQVWRLIVQQGITDLTQIPYAKLSLPNSMARLLPEHFRVFTSSVVSEQTSGDGTTTKMVVQLQDGHQVECVIMRFENSSQRSTLCVSSQGVAARTRDLESAVCVRVKVRARP